MQLSAADIASFAAGAGFQGPDLITAVAIALAESSGNPNAIGDQSLAPANGPSIGLWQINIGSQAHPELAGANLQDPATNAAAAYGIYSASGFRPWTTYGSGKYLLSVSQAQNGVLAIAAPGAITSSADGSTPEIIPPNSMPAPAWIAIGILALILLSDLLD